MIICASAMARFQTAHAEGEMQVHGNRHTLRQRDVDSLPSVTVSEEDDLLTQACAICLDDFNPSATVKVLPCGHHFHEQCVSEWLTRWKYTCPLCKVAVELESTVTQELLTDLETSPISGDAAPTSTISLEQSPLIELRRATTSSMNYTNPQL